MWSVFLVCVGEQLLAHGAHATFITVRAAMARDEVAIANKAQFIIHSVTAWTNVGH
jgi:hypothetical protein